MPEYIARPDNTLNAYCRQLFAEASEGHAADITEMVKPIERWAGVTIG